MVYALLVRDIRGDASMRRRLDAILAGEVVLDADDGGNFDASAVPDTSTVPGISTRPSREELERSWGTTPQAQAGKAALDQLLGRTR